MNDDLTLVEILGEDDTPPSVPGVHDAIAARLLAVAGSPDDARRYSITVSDPRAFVVDMVERNTGRAVGPNATWVRYVDKWRGRGLLAVAQPGYANTEADLIVLAEPGVLTRHVLRDLCWWAFRGLGFERVVARLQPSEAHLADYLRRAGFLHEGAAYDFFGPSADAALWGMTIHRCRWLAPSRLAIPAADTSPPPSILRH